MKETIIETILKQISQLPIDQQRRLRQLLEQQDPPTGFPLDKRVPPKPVPDSKRETKGCGIMLGSTPTSGLPSTATA